MKKILCIKQLCKKHLLHRFRCNISHSKSLRLKKISSQRSSYLFKEKKGCSTQDVNASGTQHIKGSLFVSGRLSEWDTRSLSFNHYIRERFVQKTIVSSICIFPVNLATSERFFKPNDEHLWRPITQKLKKSETYFFIRFSTLHIFHGHF